MKYVKRLHTWWLWVISKLFARAATVATTTTSNESQKIDVASVAVAEVPPHRQQGNARKKERERSRRTLKRSAKRSRTQLTKNPDTFASLLDSLEDIEAGLMLPQIRRGWLSKNEVAQIQKLGIHVPTPWNLERVSDPVHMPTNWRRSLLVTASICPVKEYTETIMQPRFMFSLKETSLPRGVQPIKGQPFKFGWCFEVRGEEKPDPTAPPKHFWVWGWVVVEPDGRIAIPLQHQDHFSYINARRAYGDGASRSRLICIHQQRWVKPAIVRPDKSVNNTPEAEFENMTKCLFRQLHKWWDERDSRWNVICLKDGKRMTFGIEPHHTASYFEDRQLTVVGIGGRRKPIIHFVREHVRESGARVKAHLRGEDEFKWLGYDVKVLAPKISGNVYTIMPLDPVELSREEFRKNKTSYLNTDQVLDVIIEKEGENRRRLH